MLHMPSYILFWVLILNLFSGSISQCSPFHCCVFWKAAWKQKFSLHQVITILQFLTPRNWSAPPAGSGVLLEVLVILSPQVGWGGCVCVCSVAQSCLTLCNTMDCNPPGSSVPGIFQVRILEWVVLSSSKRYFQLRDWTQVSCIPGRCFNLWATREAPQTYQ